MIMMMIIISVVVADLRIKNCWGQTGTVGPSTKTGNRNLMITKTHVGRWRWVDISGSRGRILHLQLWRMDFGCWSLQTFWKEKYVGLDFRPIVTLSTKKDTKQKYLKIDLTWAMVRTVCLCKKHSPLIVWAIVWLSIPRYTWRHPTISHTLSGFGRESPAGHPKKKRFCRGHFYVSCFCSLESWLLCKLFCNVRKLILFLRNIPSWILLPKKDFTLSSAVSATILHSVVCCQPILCSTSRPCTVVWWQILTLRNLFYKYMINIASVTLIPVWSGKCWKVKYLLRILCQVLPKCRPSRCQAFLAQEACNQVFWTKK